MLQALAIVLIVAADQAVKFLIRTGYALGESHEVIKGILSLTYVQNTGAAFSSLSSHTWVLTALSAALSIAIAAVLIKRVFRHPLAVWSLTAVLGGAVGNLIDRAFLGFVVDMFQLDFFRFPVFNVADIFITAGGVGIVVYLLFIYKGNEQKEKK